MGDLVDDDFGDIYADVEIQAFNSTASTNFTALGNTHPQNDDVHQQLKSKDTDKGSLNLDLKHLNSNSEDGYDSDSDSDSDFKIVLNEDDDDCQVFSASSNADKDSFNQEEDDFCQNENTFGVSSCSGDRKVDDSVPVVFDNSHKQHNPSSNGQLARSYAASKSMSYGGYGFSLPWYRTILEVDIDAFEQKRWRSPGVDMSDFFNFGFNEDSWKQYCISLEQLRRHSYTHSRSLNLKYLNHTQGCEPPSKHKKAAKHTVVDDISQDGSSQKVLDVEETLMGLPKGRAIQVEETTVERQPTMDYRHPRTWDSDVVIEINVQDSNGDASGFNKEEFLQMDDSEHKKSRSRDAFSDKIKDIHCHCVVGAAESSMNRHIQSMTDSNQKLLDPNNHFKDGNLDIGGYHDHKVNTYASEEIAQVTGVTQKADDEKPGNGCNTDQCLTETELSSGERSHFSLTFSASGSYSEAYTDSVESIPEVSGHPSRRSYLGGVLQESVSPGPESPKNYELGGTPVYSGHHSRRSTLWEGRKHQKRRLDEVVEQRTHPCTRSDHSPFSRDRLSINYNRERERLCDYDYRNREDSSYDDLGDFLGCNYVDRSSNNHVKHPFGKKDHRGRNWNESNLQERNLMLDDIDVMGRDRVYGGREISNEGTMLFTNREYKRLDSKSKNYEVKGIRRRRSFETVHHGMKINVDSRLCGHKNVDIDDIKLQKDGRSIPFNSPKRDLDEDCEADIPFVGRGNLCRRIQYDDDSPKYLENSRCMEIEDEFCNLDRGHLSFWPQRKFSAAARGRWKNMIPQRSIPFDPKWTERSERERRERQSEKCGDSYWIDNCDDFDNAEDGFSYSGEYFHQRRKYRSQSGVQCQMQTESVWRQHSSTKRSSCLYRNSTECQSIQDTHKSIDDYMLVDDVKLEWNRYKMLKGERNVGVLNKNNMMSRGDHEWTARRRNHPLNLIFRERKFAKEQRSLKDFNHTRTGRAIGSGIAKFKGNQMDKWRKIPAMMKVGHLNSEEGQIAPKKPTLAERLGKKCASESAPGNMKKVFNSGNEINKRYDDQQILESLVKMERRRERFKEPAAL